MARERKWINEAQRKAAKLEAQRQRRLKPIEADSMNEAVSASSDEADSPDEADSMKPIEAVKPIECTGGPGVPPSGFVWFVDQPHVPHDVTKAPWVGYGRMVPVTYKGTSYVLIARHRGPVDVDAPQDGVVTATDWHARLNQRCEHDRDGWACHAC